MKKNIVECIMQLSHEKGADFTEIFEEQTRNSSVLLKDKKVESVKAGTDFGIGIRMVYGNDVLYGFTSKENEKHLLSIVNKLAATRKNSGKTRSVTAGQIHGPEKVENSHVIAIDPRNIAQSAKLDILRRAENTAREHSNLITQVAVSAVDVVSDISIINSEGLWLEDTYTRYRFSISVTAGNNGDMFIARESPGALRGFEFLESLDVEEYALKASKRAILMLSAGYIDGKKMPVVMGNGFGGVIFHEACGHPLETEAIRRKASPFIGRLGQKIAHEKVTAVDDGTITNGWGSFNVDDEGTPAQKTVLIENGILKNFMSDRVAAKELNLPVTGNARRESYKFAPVSRMRNTYIAAGTDSFNDMIGSVEYGLYAKKMGGGSVNPATGEFNFAVEEGYIINKGRIDKPLRGAALIGKGYEVLQEISMIGNDLEFAAGMCGAGSGLIPTSVGQPTIMVDKILVGGH